ncbi:hypothetical protein MGN70_006349 [Eutypa lata]|nr:hypothetical protein MGN70_006349 [Eutypa lata]
MASPYDIQSYLFDRANIQDTLTRMPLCIDTKSIDGLIKDVYAPEVEIDYTSLLGGEPSKTTGEGWSRSLEPLGKVFDSTQHVYTSFLIELPQPSPSTSSKNSPARPDSCTVVAYGGAHMMRKGAEGGSLIHNGGIAYFEVVRLRDLEERGENPWRISKQRVVMLWEDGNKELVRPMANLSAPA